MAGPRGVLPTVAVTHREFGRLIINADKVDEYREKGWAPEGEEPPTTNEPSEDKGSKSMTAREAIEVIGGLSVTELAEFISSDEDRSTVHDASDARIEELSQEEDT